MKNTRLRAIAAASCFFSTLITTAGLATAATPPYGDVGPRAVKVEAFNATTDVVFPTSGAASPLIIASHGFSANGSNQLGWAKHFASYGFVVAVPTFPSPLSPDTQVNAGIIAKLATDLRQAATASKYNILSTSKVGLEGHSAGGLATAVAADKLQSAVVGAVVLFDPVDRDDVGKAAYAKLCAPILGIFAAPSSCNNQTGWRAFATTTGAETVGFDVVGSTHCDGENADRPLCSFACGSGASPERQKVYGSYATAFFLAKLTSDAAAAAVLSSSSIAADTAIAKPLQVTPSTICSTQNSGGTDAGTDGGSDGKPNGGTSSSGGSSGGASGSPSSASSSGNAGNGNNADPPTNGDGCAAGGTTTGDWQLPSTMMMLALVLLFKRSRPD